MVAELQGACLDTLLWQRLAAHPIGGRPEAAQAFTRRLARENLWTPAQAEAVVQEYRRFCYLACTAGQELTPSDAVDQAWHLHLTCTRDYWDVFCPQVLGRQLHHGPTDGSAADAARFRRQYADTLARYAASFGHAAPAAIWPAPEQRFRAGGIRIDASQFLLVRKRSLPGRLLQWFARPGQ
jgi:hypothetical protein